MSNAHQKNKHITLLGITSYVLVFFLLTVLTQIGGVVFLLSMGLAGFIRVHDRWLRRLIKFGLFALLYIITILVIAPPLANLGGRVPLPCVADAAFPLEPVNKGYCLLLRNYVVPEVKADLLKLSEDVSQAYPGSTIRYLDAGFPFWNGFPLIPHISHKDGRKVDLAYFYRLKTDQQPVYTSPSWLGYWFYEPPANPQGSACIGRAGWLRWDFDWLQPRYQAFEIDEVRTRSVLKRLTKTAEKILLEPHLQRRLNVESPVIRFQGCHAARHDDHIHVQW